MLVAESATPAASSCCPLSLLHPTEPGRTYFAASGWLVLLAEHYLRSLALLDDLSLLQAS